jgi:alanyl-tRNA synthetase
MDSKLFYQNAYIKSFSTIILKQAQDDGGKWYVILEQTAFYPTGGGQPYDTGLLNANEVTDVIEVDGEIRHYVKVPFEEGVTKVEGQINWERRFDHMQQHAGQHILSAAFEELLQYKTLSFHLGQDILTIDIDVEVLTSQEAALVEKRANEIILVNSPIHIKWISKNELSSYPLRKQPTVTDNIRLVIIPDFDYNGCGGTHPKTTGEVAAVKILNWERQKKKTRVHFVCGTRVLKQLDQKHKITTKIVQLLNTPENDLVNTLEQHLKNNKMLERQLEEIKLSLLHYEAKEMLTNSIIINRYLVISKVDANRSLKEIQQLSRLVASLEKEAVVIVISENQSQLQVVAARGEANALSMKGLLHEILPIINGKGGGTDSMAQGGGEALVSGKELLRLALDQLQTNKS